MINDVHILAIETSCDETAAAVVKNGTCVLSNVISSQIDIHAEFGGVVPEIASRKHIENIDYVILEALKTANMNFDDVDAVAVTYGPGLVGALLVGLSTAKAISFATKKPLIGVHHIEGHICANYIDNEDFKPPFICLVVSGGHTHLVHVKDYNEFEILGKTLDDAAGEAFDKVARVIGLGYPGGPKIDKLVREHGGDRKAIQFPRAYISEGSYDFSFSGIKSAVLNYVNKCKMADISFSENDLAASFQEAVIEVLVSKAIKAAEEKKISKIALAGGVASNSFLREAMGKACQEKSFLLNVPKPVYCTDNAAMIGSAAYYEFIKNRFFDLDLNAYPNLRLGQRL